MAKPGSIQSERAEKAQRLFAVSKERKALEKEEEALKDFFKKDCGGVPMLYEAGDVMVETTVDTRTAVDSGLVRAAFGDKYDKTTSFMKVVAREKPKEAK